MPLVSMTGFADVQGASGDFRWHWEAKSVNGRSLDLRWRLPSGFDRLEAQGRVVAAGKFKRGNLQISLTLERAEGSSSLRVDPAALAAVVAAARSVAAETGLPPARVDGLLALKGVLVTADAELSDSDKAALDTQLLEGLVGVLDALAVSRANEGAKLSALMAGHVDRIDALTKNAAALAATQPEALRARLATQIADLVAPGTVTEERLAQEVAMMAVRADVREELDRLCAHVGEARRLMAQETAVGRKLDFLAQEFNRETNTLCSKSADVELTRVGLDLKSVIDQFREQAANVE